eukprot:6293667-Amphidinium_carterae.1
MHRPRPVLSASFHSRSSSGQVTCPAKMHLCQTRTVLKSAETCGSFAGNPWSHQLEGGRLAQASPLPNRTSGAGNEGRTFLA